LKALILEFYYYIKQCLPHKEDHSDDSILQDCKIDL